METKSRISLFYPRRTGYRVKNISQQDYLQNYNYQYSYQAVLNRLKKLDNRTSKLKFLDKAIKYNYWHKPAIFTANQKSGKPRSYDNEILINFYKLALKLAPRDKKYLTGLASVYRMDNQIANAAIIWQYLLNQNPKDYHSLLNIALYTQLNQREHAFEKSLHRLNKINPAETEQLKHLLNLIQHVPALKPNYAVDDLSLWDDSRHYIVILGAALTIHGNIKEKLRRRLAAGLKLARLQPKAKIIVSGGQVPQEPHTEASKMIEWLVEHGVKRQRILKEEKSRDTVQNAINSNLILQINDARKVTLVSSNNHIQRAYALFQSANYLQGIDYDLQNYAVHETGPQIQPAVHKIISDMLRVKGYWLLPDIQP
ncbi:YdcF family protein [Apilactobacillus xinyiensis]|uniref:YdcF family protein n=1 Tax=Apilactobacillus xinyiensis TaxID=2841032 RepID=UPI001C7D1788|nr:YdcF family protein [Apilactobacillus xinyiensis]